jgi:hypothetical protein
MVEDSAYTTFITAIDSFPREVLRYSIDGSSFSICAAGRLPPLKRAAGKPGGCFGNAGCRKAATSSKTDPSESRRPYSNEYGLFERGSGRFADTTDDPQRRVYIKQVRPYGR